MTNTPDLRSPSVDLPGGGAMPLLGFGTWQLRGDEALTSVAFALEAGYRHIDSATGYRNETEVGRAVRDSGLSRDDVFITTKMPPDHVGRERQTLEESLSALGVDRIDLWLIHWPPNGTAGVDSWKVFVQAREEGLVRDIGVSNYSLAQIDELTQATGVTPAVNQIKWNPFLYDQAIVDGHRERNVVLEGYSPFRAAQLDHEVVTELAEKYGKTPAQIIVRWHVEHGFVVIPKSARRERIVANVDVLDFELSADDVARLDALGN